MDILSSFQGQLAGFWHYPLVVLDFIWPFVALGVSIFLARSTWLFWRQELYIRSSKYILLEIKIPREVRKSPKAMEQVLAGIHALRNFPGDLAEKYWWGEVTRWFSLEMVSFSGEIHFYIYVYHKQKNLVSAAFFAYYPDIELVEVEDYVNRLPPTNREMYRRGYDLWGSEIVLARPDAYPIKNYDTFEAVDEDKQFDPISTFLELLGKLKKDEFVGIQIIIAPADNDWEKKWKGLVDKLKEPKIKETPSKSGADQFRSFAKMIARSPGETDVLKAIEENLSRRAFDTLIRFIYVSPKPIFYDSYARRGLRGSFNQYAALDLNYFKDNQTMSTRTRLWHWPHIFPNWRNEYRKQRLLYTYARRLVPPETFMGRFITSYFFNLNFHSRRFKMTTAGVATLFHPPTFIVLTAPHVPRVESRKAGPPAGLAIFGEEGEIDKLM